MSHELSKHKDTKFSMLNTKYLTESLDPDMLIQSINQTAKFSTLADGQFKNIHWTNY